MAKPCPPSRRLHSLVGSWLNSEESPFIGSYLAFKRHLSQSRGQSQSHLRHLQIHIQRRCLGHTSFSIHGGNHVISVPLFQYRMNRFIGQKSLCNWVDARL